MVDSRYQVWIFSRTVTRIIYRMSKNLMNMCVMPLGSQMNPRDRGKSAEILRTGTFPFFMFSVRACSNCSISEDLFSCSIYFYAIVRLHWNVSWSVEFSFIQVEQGSMKFFSSGWRNLDPRIYSPLLWCKVF